MGIGEQPASSISQEIKDIDLDGIIGNEQLIIEESTDPEGKSYISFAIRRLYAELDDWRTEYTWTVDNPSSYDMENCYWNVTGAPVILLKVRQRSGDSLSYRVIGYICGSLREIIARDNLVRGNVFFYGSGIIEQSEMQYFIWTVVDGELTLIPY